MKIIVPTSKVLRVKRFKLWMAAASTLEKKRLARLAGTPYTYLYAIAAGDKVCQSDLAGKIADASKILRVESHGKLPLLWRGDLSPVCRECPYSPKCKE